MLTVCFKPLLHRQKENIGIYYPNNAEINIVVRKLKDIRWSQTHKCWYLPLSKSNFEALANVLTNLAAVDDKTLRQYLQKKKEVVKTMVPAPSKAGTVERNNPVAASPTWKLSKENLEALQRFVEQLKLKAYSPSTIKTYRNEFLQLLQLLKKKTVNELTPDDLRRYFVYCFEN